jgi:hypothetical protein
MRADHRRTLVSPTSRVARGGVGGNSHGHNRDRDASPNIDCSAVFARRCREILAAVLEDLGGAKRLPETRVQLVRRFAASAALAEQMEERLVCGEQINIAEHALLSSTLVRIAQIIGVDRTTRDVTPTLADYLRSEQME